MLRGFYTTPHKSHQVGCAHKDYPYNSYDEK